MRWPDRVNHGRRRYLRTHQTGLRSAPATRYRPPSAGDALPGRQALELTASRLAEREAQLLSQARERRMRGP